MKESNFLLHIAHMKQSQMDHIAAIKQFEREVLKNTKSQFVKDSSTFANIAAMKQLQLDILKNTKSKYMKNLIFLYIL